MFAARCVSSPFALLFLKKEAKFLNSFEKNIQYFDTQYKISSRFYNRGDLQSICAKPQYSSVGPAVFSMLNSFFSL